VYSYSLFHRNKPSTHSANKEGPEVEMCRRSRAAIQKLKKEINLNKRNLEHEFQIHMNASDMRLSLLLMHIQERPISFVSRQLNTVGKKLSLT
jgi:hypothetical protein